MHRHVFFPGLERLGLPAVRNDFVLVAHHTSLERDQAVGDLECRCRDVSLLGALPVDCDHAIAGHVVEHKGAHSFMMPEDSHEIWALFGCTSQRVATCGKRQQHRPSRYEEVASIDDMNVGGVR